MNKPIYDLIYDDSLRAKFAEKYPTAKIEDACDEVHDSRFAITLPPGITDREYFKFLLENLEIGGASFILGLAIAQQDKMVLDMFREIKKKQDEEKP